MKKLTSSEIDWEDDMYIAVVAKNHLYGFTHKTLYPPQNVSEANDRFYIGSDWYLMDEYYIVYRESQPVKKTVVDAVNSSIANRARSLMQGTMYNKEQFNQCVKELSEASWMNDGEPMYYHVYKQAFKDMEAMETKPTYKYEKVTDLTLNEIAKAMIDGEVFYNEVGNSVYKWNGAKFTCDMNRCIVVGDYYRKVETTPEQIQIDKIATIIEDCQDAGLKPNGIAEVIVSKLK